MPKKKYHINSFFAGIGGFDVAFEKQGFSTSLLCEINPFCNQILNRHWPNVMKEGDINTIKVENIPDVELWCGGFPCQDISVARGASERLGLKGKRSGLFYRFADLIEQKCRRLLLLKMSLDFLLLIMGEILVSFCKHYPLWDIVSLGDY